MTPLIHRFDRLGILPVRMWVLSARGFDTSAFCDLGTDVHDVDWGIESNGPRKMKSNRRGSHFAVPSAKQLLVGITGARKRHLFAEFVFLGLRRVGEPSLVTRKMFLIESVPFRRTLPLFVEAPTEIIEEPKQNLDSFRGPSGETGARASGSKAFSAKVSREHTDRIRVASAVQEAMLGG